MPKFIALKSFRYATRHLEAGNPFEASDRDGRLLVAVRKARHAKVNDGATASHEKLPAKEREDVQVRATKRPEQKDVRHMSLGVHAGLAQDAQTDSASTDESQRASAGQHEPATGKTDPAAMRGLPVDQSGETPRRLLQAVGGSVVLPGASSPAPQDADGDAVVPADGDASREIDVQPMSTTTVPALVPTGPADADSEGGTTDKAADVPGPGPAAAGDADAKTAAAKKTARRITSTGAT